MWNSTWFLRTMDDHLQRVLDWRQWVYTQDGKLNPVSLSIVVAVFGVLGMWVVFEWTDALSLTIWVCSALTTSDEEKA